MNAAWFDMLLPKFLSVFSVQIFLV